MLLSRGRTAYLARNETDTSVWKPHSTVHDLKNQFVPLVSVEMGGSPRSDAYLDWFSLFVWSSMNIIRLCTSCGIEECTRPHLTSPIS